MRCILSLILLLVSGSAYGVDPERVLIVFAYNGEGDAIARTTSRTARIYSDYFKGNSNVTVLNANLANSLPYSPLFGSRAVGRENILGPIRTEEYDRVVYVVGSHGRTSPAERFAVEIGHDTWTPVGKNSPFVRQLVDFAPKAKARDLILLTCHAGAFDPKDFPGSIFGGSPSDGELREGDIRALNAALKKKTYPPPVTPREFFSTWGKVMQGATIEEGYAPIWLSELSGEKRTNQGHRRAEGSKDDICVQHRSWLLGNTNQGTRSSTPRCSESVAELGG